MSFITINNLNFNYNNNNIINNLNLEIANGDFVALLGPSGSGKSTLLKILAKILLEYGGDILINNTNLKDYKKPFAYMPQNHLLFSWRTLLENVIIPLVLQKNSLKDAKEIVKPYLEEFNLTKYINSYPSNLSGGQKQRAALLRSILLPTNFLLLDEPFSQLDAITRVKLQKFLHKLYQKYNYTVLLVTHDIDEAILLANKIHIINHKGNIANSFLINLPLNRNEEITLNSNFLQYKKQIITALKNATK